ncbi:MAG: DNA-protecting protein DprA, partial [Candidatus Kerfeldbacteria bacterium]|nr:DNA-protecting protein DprA [Candidatus Kerfeldbacteria bacterium]
RALAVVGTRRPSAYGRLMVRTLVPALVEAGYAIVSGLAYGIDADVHQATLDAGGTTWAVLGSGIDQAGPLQNVGLAHRIVEHGGTLVSEYRAGTEAQAYHFPIRNRIIAGLTLATIVIEAPRRSGALITAREALDENREVFAVPHDTTRPSGEGTNALLRAGAHLAATPDDILAVLEPSRSVPTMPRVAAPETPIEQSVVELLQRGPQSIDQCVAASGADPSAVITSLSMLELRGVVRHLGGQTFALVGQRGPSAREKTDGII